VIPEELLPAYALVEFVTGDRQVILSQELELTNKLEVELESAQEGEDDLVRTARIYCWSDVQGRGAICWATTSY
jgi:hypothetical protein